MDNPHHSSLGRAPSIDDPPIMPHLAQDMGDADAKSLNAAAPLLTVPFEVNINSEKLTSTVLWVTKCFQIVESHLLSNRQELSNITKRLELAEASQDQWKKVANLIETFGSRLDKMEAEPQLLQQLEQPSHSSPTADQQPPPQLPLPPAQLVQQAPPENPPLDQGSSPVSLGLPSPVAFQGQSPLASEPQSPSSERLLSQPQSPTSPGACNPQMWETDNKKLPEAMPALKLAELDARVPPESTGLVMQAGSPSHDSIGREIAVGETRFVVTADAQQEKAAESQAEKEAAAAAQDKMQAEVRCAQEKIQEDVAGLNNALRHVEDIVRGDVKNLADVVDSLQRGLSLSGERIDDLFRDLGDIPKQIADAALVVQQSRGDSELNSTTDSVMNNKKCVSEVGVQKLPPDGDLTSAAELDTKTESTPSNVSPIDSRYGYLAGPPSGAADWPSMQKPGTPGAHKPGTPGGLKPTSASMFVSKPSLEETLKHMRDSVADELEQIRSSILETVKAKIEAGRPVPASAGKDTNVDPAGAKTAMFFRCPPPTFACCASCNAPLPDAKIRWGKQHPMYSSGPFPQRAVQKAVPKSLTSKAEVMVESPLRLASQDLGKAVMLPALACTGMEQTSSMSMQMLPSMTGMRGMPQPKELPKSFKANLRKTTTSFPAMATSASLPGIVNIGADFQRHKSRTQFVRGGPS